MLQCCVPDFFYKKYSLLGCGAKLAGLCSWAYRGYADLVSFSLGDIYGLLTCRLWLVVKIYVKILIFDVVCKGYSSTYSYFPSISL